MGALKSLIMIMLYGITVALPTNNTPKGNRNMASKQEQINYLTKYRYYGEKSPDKEIKKLMETDPDEAFRDAVKLFQKFYDLEVTGEVDEATQTVMEQPRCGNPDLTTEQEVEELKSTSRRSKRYGILYGGGWRKTHLTYRIRNYPTKGGLSETQVDDAITRAFNEWAKVTPLTFQRVYYYPDIEILFAAGDHGDGDPFDGRFGTLAHTFFPIYGGDAHFDNDEVWTLNYYRGTDLFQIAVHEFGHALGLDHTVYRDAVMYAIYRYNSYWQLHWDDIAGIRAIYGRNTETTTMTSLRRETTTSGTSLKTSSITSGTAASSTTMSSSSTTSPTSTTTSNSPIPEDGDSSDFCAITSIDAITIDDTGKAVVFKGKYVALLNEIGIAEGYPKLITDMYNFPFLPSSIDAAVQLDAIKILRCYWYYYRQYCYETRTEAAATYFFKGDQYYMFRNGAFKEQGSISSKFSGVPSNIDAAMTTTGKHVYFIKGSNLYRVQRGKTYVDSGYPIPLSAAINGLPNKIDASYVLKGPGYHLNYYFSGSQYYRVSNSDKWVDFAFPPYPRDIKSWWFTNCPASSSMLISMHDENGSEFSQSNHTIVDNIYIDENGDAVSDFEWGKPEDENNSISGCSKCQQLPIGVFVMCYLLFNLL